MKHSKASQGSRIGTGSLWPAQRKSFAVGSEEQEERLEKKIRYEVNVLQCPSEILAHSSHCTRSRDVISVLGAVVDRGCCVRNGWTLIPRHRVAVCRRFLKR